MHLIHWALVGMLVCAATSHEPTSPYTRAGHSQQQVDGEHDTWMPPLGAGLTVSRHFDLSRGPYQAGHRGIDLPASRGDQVRSPTAGVVSFVGVVANKPVLSLRVDAHTVVSFEPLLSDLALGESVSRGGLLGTVDVGGHCERSCLHVGVRIDDAYVNPLRFFWRKPVLLAWNA